MEKLKTLLLFVFILLFIVLFKSGLMTENDEKAAMVNNYDNLKNVAQYAVITGNLERVKVYYE